jgi:hypothetical protein
MFAYGKRLSVITALALLAAAPAPVFADGAADGRPDHRKGGIVEPGHAFFGKSYNELASDWNNWLAAEPNETNPALDNDGIDCGRNQRGPVWFLAGTFGGAFGEDVIADRRCTIPAGKAIFFALAAFVSFAPDFAKDPTCVVLPGLINRIRCDVNDDVPLAPNIRLKASIDGKPVRDLFAYRVQSPPGGFVFRIAPGSPLTRFVPAGVRKPAVADGYYLYLKPLSRGDHTLRFSADTNADGTPDLGANYRLTVERRQRD